MKLKAKLFTAMFVPTVALTLALGLTLYVLTNQTITSMVEEESTAIAELILGMADVSYRGNQECISRPEQPGLGRHYR